MVDNQRWDTERAAVCNLKEFPQDDGVRGLLNKATCGGYNNGWLVAYAFTKMDEGDDDVLWPAAVVGLCGEILEDDGMGNPAISEYIRYRQCQTEAAKVTPEALAATLEEHAPNEVAALSFQVFFEEGLGRLEVMRPVMEKWEKGYPANRKMYDDAVAQVDEKYAPILTVWQPTFVKIDDWMETLSGGPGYAEGCVGTYTGMLQEYVDRTDAARTTTPTSPASTCGGTSSTT